MTVCTNHVAGNIAAYAKCYSPSWLGLFVGQKASLYRSSLCGNTQAQRESAEGACRDSPTLLIRVQRMPVCIVFLLSLTAACMCSAYMSLVCMSLSTTEWGLYVLWGWNAHTPECARVHTGPRGHVTAIMDPDRILSLHTNIHTHRACDMWFYRTPNSTHIPAPTQCISLETVNTHQTRSQHKALWHGQLIHTHTDTHLSVSSWCVCVHVCREGSGWDVFVTANADERGRK